MALKFYNHKYVEMYKDLQVSNNSNYWNENTQVSKKQDWLRCGFWKTEIK